MHRLIVVVSILILHFCQSIVAQNATFPYQLSKRVDIGLAVPITGLNVAYPLLGNRTYRIQPNYFEQLKPTDIWPRWDQSATRQYSLRAQRTSDILMLSALATPVLLSLSDKNRNLRNGGTVAVMGLEILLLTNGLTHTTKQLTRRVRPYAYNPNVPEHLKYKPDTWHSFFSGHTSISTSACFFTAQVYSDLYPDSRWKPLVWGTAIALPATVGYFRYKGGKHFPTDILTGFAVGAISGLVVPYLHKKRG
jgi:hypothetical protein